MRNRRPISAKKNMVAGIRQNVSNDRSYQKIPKKMQNNKFQIFSGALSFKQCVNILHQDRLILNRINFADQLRGEIDTLIQKQDKADTQTWKAYVRFQKLKAQGDEKEAEFHWMSYQTWKEQLHRLGEKILVKLKAVQKFESLKKMEKPRINDKKKQQYMKYGPSDASDEE